jgi:hypothetical protein
MRRIIPLTLAASIAAAAGGLAHARTQGAFSGVAGWQMLPWRTELAKAERVLRVLIPNLLPPKSATAARGPGAMVARFL